MTTLSTEKDGNVDISKIDTRNVDFGELLDFWDKNPKDESLKKVISKVEKRELKKLNSYLDECRTDVNDAFKKIDGISNDFEEICYNFDKVLELYDKSKTIEPFVPVEDSKSTVSQLDSPAFPPPDSLPETQKKIPKRDIKAEFLSSFDVEADEEGVYYFGSGSHKTRLFLPVDPTQKYRILFQYKAIEGENANPNVFVEFYESENSIALGSEDMNILKDTIKTIRSVEPDNDLIEFHKKADSWKNVNQRGNSFYVGISRKPDCKEIFHYIKIENQFRIVDGWRNDDLVIKGSYIDRKKVKKNMDICLVKFFDSKAKDGFYTAQYFIYPRNSKVDNYNTVFFNPSTKFIKLDLKVVANSDRSKIAVKKLNVVKI
jgi:hypothetical protein